MMNTFFASLLCFFCLVVVGAKVLSVELNKSAAALSAAKYEQRAIDKNAQAVKDCAAGKALYIMVNGVTCKNH